MEIGKHTRLWPPEQSFRSRESSSCPRRRLGRQAFPAHFFRRHFNRLQQSVLKDRFGPRRFRSERHRNYNDTPSPAERCKRKVLNLNSTREPHLVVQLQAKFGRYRCRDFFSARGSEWARATLRRRDKLQRMWATKTSGRDAAFRAAMPKQEAKFLWFSAFSRAPSPHEPESRATLEDRHRTVPRIAVR